MLKGDGGSVMTVSRRDRKPAAASDHSPRMSFELQSLLLPEQLPEREMRCIP